MTSFLATTLGSFVSHLPGTVTAVLATSRTIMNCSTVPVLLSTDELWDRLLSVPWRVRKEEHYLILFSNFSDTMQFTEKLRFSEHGNWQYKEDVLNKILENLIQNKRYFTRTVQHITFPTLASIGAICPHLLNIKSIDPKRVSECLKDNHLESICRASFARQLTKLDLSNNLYITDKGAAHLSLLKNLQELDISRTTQISHLKTFIKEMPLLRELNLSLCQKMTDSFFDFGEDGDETVDTTTTVLTSLEKIDISSARLSDVTFQRLEKLAPNLTNLKCGNVKTDGLLAISNMFLLRKLDIYGCGESINEATVRALITNLKHLEFLGIVGAFALDDTCLRLISESSAPIRRLGISQCSGCFTDAGFRCLTSLDCLESLIIYASGHETDFTGDIGENRLPKSLKELLIGSCKSLSDRGVMSMLKQGRTSLTSLTLCDAPKLTSEGLRKALGCCNNNNNDSDGVENNMLLKKSLKKLNVEENEGLDDLSFVEGLTSLTSLDISRNSFDYSSMRGNNSQNKGLSLVAGLPNLEKLILATDGEIEDIDVIEFASSSSAAAADNATTTTIKELNLNGCTELTSRIITSKEGLGRLSSSLEKLHVDELEVVAVGDDDTDVGNNNNTTKAGRLLQMVDFVEKRFPYLTELDIERSLRCLGPDEEKEMWGKYGSIVRGFRSTV